MDSNNIGILFWKRNADVDQGKKCPFLAFSNYKCLMKWTGLNFPAILTWLAYGEKLFQSQELEKSHTVVHHVQYHDARDPFSSTRGHEEIKTHIPIQNTHCFMSALMVCLCFTYHVNVCICNIYYPAYELRGLNFDLRFVPPKQLNS